MKNRKTKLICLSTITLSILTAGPGMAQSTWTGGTSTAWNEANNWLDTATLLVPGVPASSTTLNFGGATYGVPANLPTNNDLLGFTTGAINFTNNGLAGQTAGFTLGTLGQTVTLGGNISTSAIASGGSAITDTINLNLILNNNRTISTNGGGTGTGSHSVTVNGVISETGGARILTKGGGFPSGTLTLNGNNTYTGFTVVETGTVTVSKIADSGESNLGYGAQITLSFGGSGATLNYTGNGSTTGRKVQLGSSNAGQLGGTAGGTISANGTNGGTGLVFTAPTFIQTVSSTAASRTLTLQGSNTDANQISGSIIDVETEILPAVTTATNVTKSNGGRWILSGDNTYTGPSSVTAGNLNIRHANALGSTVAGTTVGNGAQLELEGSGISYAAEALTLNSGTSGVAMLRNISGDNTWNGTVTATTVVGTTNLARIQSDAGTLTLAGAMSGAGADNSFVLQGAGNIDVTSSISGAIRLNSGTNGAGVRTLSNANTYGGNTTVGGGVLRLNNANSIPGGIGLTGGTSNIILSGGVLGLGNGNLTRALGSGVDQIQLTASGTGFAAYGADRSVNFGGASAPVTFGDPGFFSGVGGNPAIVLGSTTATHTLDFQNPVVLAGVKFFTAINGPATVDARLSGAITGTTSFSKNGNGTLELTNTGNAWTGVTFIDSGTLRLGAADVLPSTTVEIKRGAGTDTNPILDLNGFSETIGGLTIGSATTDVNNSGQSITIVNSAGGPAVLTLTGTFLYRAGSAGFENGQATISANLDTGNPARNLTVNDGAGAVDLLISGVISGSGNGFNKAGAGTLVISGANSYTGPTSVGVGTLRLGANNTLPDGTAVSISTATLDAATFSNQAGTLNVTAVSPGVATINLGTGGTLAFDDSSGVTWAGGTLNITGAFVSGSSIKFENATGLTATQLGLITINGVSGSYTLSPTGFLLNGAADPFDIWASGAGFDIDTNNDGVKNGLAWLLGASGPNVNANGLLPVVTQTGGSLKMTFDMLPAAARDGAQLLAEHSSDLGTGDPWTGVLVPDASGGSAPVTFIVNDSNPVDPENPLDVEVTISSTEAAAGKLFGRLRAAR